VAGVVSWAAVGRVSGRMQPGESPMQPGEERAWRRLSKGECRACGVGDEAGHVVVCSGVGFVGGLRRLWECGCRGECRVTCACVDLV
jgi:hypothetical protein